MSRVIWEEREGVVTEGEVRKGEDGKIKQE
jgi:hypothetical protein